MLFIHLSLLLFLQIIALITLTKEQSFIEFEEDKKFYLVIKIVKT